MVFDGVGHAYSVKEKYPDGSIVWRCVKRNCKGRGTKDCYGSAKETVSGEFFLGMCLSYPSVCIYYKYINLNCCFSRSSSSM